MNKYIQTLCVKFLEMRKMMMKMKKYLACLTAAMLMAGAAVACGNQPEANSVAETTAAETTAEETTEAATEETTEETAIEVTQADVEFEDAIDAEPGQAYLAIVDGQWWVQYWGSSSKDGYMLSYDAGIADIQGDGSYTVSVTADTNGFRYDTTGNPDDQYIPEGLSFMAIRIDQGQEMYPDAVITIDSIKVDGKEIEMKAKNYTSSDDGVELRTNIYNTYVASPSQDGRSADGNLYDEDGNALDICADYSAQIVDPADFSQWTTVEVSFTITGTGTEGAADDDDADAETSAEEDADAETTAEEATDAETTAEGETDAETSAAE